jgi:hypothetical protein
MIFPTSVRLARSRIDLRLSLSSTQCVAPATLRPRVEIGDDDAPALRFGVPRPCRCRAGDDGDFPRDAHLDLTPRSI